MERVVFATSIVCVVLISVAAPIFGWLGFLIIPSFAALAAFLLYRWTVRYDGRDEERADKLGWYVAIPLRTNNRWLFIMSVLTVICLGLWLSTDSGLPPLAAQAQYELELAKSKAFGTPMTMTDPSLTVLTPWYVRELAFWILSVANLVYAVVALSDEATALGRWARRTFRSDAAEGEQPWWRRLILSRFSREPNPSVYAGGAAPILGQVAAQAAAAGQSQILQQAVSRLGFGSQLGIEVAGNAFTRVLEDIGRFLVSLFKRRR